MRICAASVAGDAATFSQGSNDAIHQLGDAAEEIGKVIEVIQDIADVDLADYEATSRLVLEIRSLNQTEQEKQGEELRRRLQELLRKTRDALEELERTANQTSIRHA